MYKYIGAVIGFVISILLSSRALVENIGPVQKVNEFELILLFITPILVGFGLGYYYDSSKK